MLSPTSSVERSARCSPGPTLMTLSLYSSPLNPSNQVFGPVAMESMESPITTSVPGHRLSRNVSSSPGPLILMLLPLFDTSTQQPEVTTLLELIIGSSSGVEHPESTSSKTHATRMGTLRITVSPCR